MSEKKRLYLWFLQVICLCGLIALLIWASLRPKTPTFTITALEILDPSTHQDAIAAVHSISRNTSINVSLEIYNPNKKTGTYYSYMNVTLYCSGVRIGTAMLSSFDQSFHETTQRNGSMSVMNMQLVKAVSRVVLNRTVDLDVRIVTMVRYRILGVMTSRYHRIDVLGNVPVGSNGRMNGMEKIMLHKTPMR